MIRNVFFITLFLSFSSLLFAQLEVKKIDGTPINNGDIISFSSFGETNAKLGLKVYNTGTATAKTKIKIVSMTNADGSNMELCYGIVCVNSVSVGSTFPSAGYDIAAGGENGSSDHFYNSAENSPTGNYPMDYELRIYIEGAGGVDVGGVTFTYRYDPNLGVDDLSTDTTLEDMGVSILNTQVTDKIGVSLEKDVSYSIYSSAGTLVQQGSMKKEEEVIDFQSTNTGVYMIQFENVEGQTAGTRIIKN